MVWRIALFSKTRNGAVPCYWPVWWDCATTGCAVRLCAHDYHLRKILTQLPFLPAQQCLKFCGLVRWWKLQQCSRGLSTLMLEHFPTLLRECRHLESAIRSRHTRVARDLLIAYHNFVEFDLAKCILWASRPYGGCIAGRSDTAPAPDIQMSGAVLDAAQSRGIDIPHPQLNVTAYDVAKEETADIDLLRRLESLGADPIAWQGNCPWTSPLLFASSLGKCEVVQFLLDRGANINATAKQRGDKRTALACAVESDRTEVIRLLLLRGAGLTNLTAENLRCICKQFKLDHKGKKAMFVDRINAWRP